MIKVNCSKQNHFAVVVFFSGKNLAQKESKYLFEESRILFGEENHCSNLVEYNTKAELDSFISSDRHTPLLLESSKHDKGKPTLVKLEVSAGSTGEKLTFCHDGKSISNSTIRVAKTSLQHLDLNLDEEVLLSDSSEFWQIDPLKYHKLIIKISEDLVKGRADQKSDKYRKFYSDRYFDSELLFYRLIPLISATADNQNCSFEGF